MGNAEYMGTVFDKLTKMKVALTLLLVSIAFAEDYYYEYYSLDDGCAGRCCTLQISRPDAESVEKYSGVYKKKGGFKTETGAVNGRPRYVKSGSNNTIWMQYNMRREYNIGYEALYFEVPSWDIEEKKGMGIQGGLESDWPMGKWPNGGEATCIKWNKKKTVCQKIQYNHEPGVNGIYDQLETDSTEWRIGDRGTTSNGSSPSGRMCPAAMREDSPKDWTRTTLMTTLMTSLEEYLRVHGPTAPLFNVSARNEDWNIWKLHGPDS